MSISTEHSWRLLFGSRALAAKTQVRNVQLSNKVKAETLQGLCGFHGPERRRLTRGWNLWGELLPLSYHLWPYSGLVSLHLYEGKCWGKLLSLCFALTSGGHSSDCRKNLHRMLAGLGSWFLWTSLENCLLDQADPEWSRIVCLAWITNLPLRRNSPLPLHRHIGPALTSNCFQVFLWQTLQSNQCSIHSLFFKSLFCSESCSKSCDSGFHNLNMVSVFNSCCLKTMNSSQPMLLFVQKFTYRIP